MFMTTCIKLADMIESNREMTSDMRDNYLSLIKPNEFNYDDTDCYFIYLLFRLPLSLVYME